MPAILKMRSVYPYAGLDTLLSDPRLKLEFADGRAFLRREREPWDVIETDALRPHAARAGNLYSFEYFTPLRDRLAPGGLGVTWAPTGRTIRTFTKASLT
jgi:spermidine synthase